MNLGHQSAAGPEHGSGTQAAQWPYPGSWVQLGGAINPGRRVYATRPGWLWIEQGQRLRKTDPRLWGDQSIPALAVWLLGGDQNAHLGSDQLDLLDFFAEAEPIASGRF